MSTKSKGRITAIVAAGAGLCFVALVAKRVATSRAERQAVMVQNQQAAQSASPDKRGPAVSIVHGKPFEWRATIQVTGSLAPIQEAELSFRSGGRIKDLKVKLGDRVSAGEVLATVDTGDAAARAAAGYAGMRAAEISASMARDAQRRTGALFSSNAVAEVDNTSAQQKSALADAQLAQARAQAALGSVSLADSKLASPFAGLVTRAPNGIGKIVGPGEPVFRVEDIQMLKLNATVSEEDARLVEVGAIVTIDKAPRGKVTAILPSLDPRTRRVPLLAEIPNRGPAPLLAGAFVRASVTAVKESLVLKLPANTLRPGSQDELVVLAGGKAHLAPVVYATDVDGSLLVRSGITESDAVVVNPSSEIREGQAMGGQLEAGK
jgi:RND family efflux transporter MFP subunit